jgi:hypothetical protein
MIKETQWKWNLKNENRNIPKDKYKRRGNSFGFLRNFLCVSNDK